MISAGKAKAAKENLRKFYEAAGADVYSFSVADDGVLIRFSKPFGKFGLKRIHHGWEAVTEIQKRMLNGG